MTLCTLFLFFVVACLLSFLNCRKLSRVFYGTGLLLFFLIGCGPMTQVLLKYLQAPYAEIPTVTWEAHNAIILLGGGNTQVSKGLPVEVGFFAQGRVNKAAALYHDCKKAAHDCKIIVSGSDVQKYGVPEAAVYAEALQHLSIMPEDIIAEDQSMNTWKNAQLTQALLKQFPAERIVLVSSGFHLRRSMLYFSHFGIDATPIRADYLRAIQSNLPLAYNFAMADLAIHEYLGYLRYYVYNMLGWNITATQPNAL